MSNLDLNEIRKQLDVIDAQIVQLIENRMELCEQVAEYKISIGKEVYDREREQQKLKTVESLAKESFNKKCAHDLFEQIMAMSRRLQYHCMIKHGSDESHGFQIVEELPKDGIRVVYQGVEGAYTQAAMWNYFGEEVDAYHVESWKEAMEDLKSGAADYGVFPIENSTAGIVSDVYDLLVQYEHYIVGEIVLPIQHALLGLEESTLEDIRKIYSHPQALMQSAGFLEEHRDWQPVSLKNTAMAAKKVLEDQDKTQAAIASIYASKLYGLKVLKNKTNDSDMNETRFIVVSNRKIYARKANKISLCFGLPHESGSLYNCLANFVYNDLNMTKVESRPIRELPWKYRFFVDIEGNLEDIAVKNAIKSIQSETSDFRLLGNY